MSEPPRARYLTTNWKTCNAALAHRGSLQIRFDPGMQWLSAPTGKRGRQPVFPDAAIQTCLTLKALFKLSLRQTTGMVASLLEMAGLDWPVPDFSTLIRRQKALLVEIPCQAGSGALHLLIDSTGIKAVGDGEWCAQTWSFQAPPVAQVPPGRRRPDTGDPGHRSYRQPDWRCPHAAELLGQIATDQPVASVSADAGLPHCSPHGLRKSVAAAAERPVVPTKRAWRSPVTRPNDSTSTTPPTQSEPPAPTPQ